VRVLQATIAQLDGAFRTADRVPADALPDGVKRGGANVAAAQADRCAARRAGFFETYPFTCQTKTQKSVDPRTPRSGPVATALPTYLDSDASRTLPAPRSAHGSDAASLIAAPTRPASPAAGGTARPPARRRRSSKSRIERSSGRRAPISMRRSRRWRRARHGRDAEDARLDQHRANTWPTAA
jgi:hypothetical protein